ncbi:hypothetical protein WG68_07210 [Arsukibacterium ikkense]|uniref:Uncharacterized protein n=1 Tax=Arsukibacterium ikkense TaxID=336831 RepID=A0A0M2V6W7_9GAMM|nr:YdbH domain-containing protein [Arsukibacterium ikkense]KKO46134.1 hypothetical protein WG68_07210 [Arsukibacterium ikkense]
MRRLVKALLIFVIGLPVLAAAGYWYLQQQISQAGVRDLQLDISRLTISSVQLRRLQFSLQQNGVRHQIDLQDVNISWQWPQPFKPKLSRLTVGPGQISLASASHTTPQTDNKALSLPKQWQLPDWLPHYISVTDTVLNLPCPAGQCQLQLTGQLSYRNSDEVNAAAANTGHPYWQSRLVMTSTAAAALPETAPLVLDAYYQATPQPMLRLTLQQEQQFGLSLKQQLNPGQNLAETELMLAISPPSPANQALLQQWGLNLPEAWLAQFQQPVQLYSKLSWQLPADGDLSKLLSSHDIAGKLIARAPDPFYLPQLGLLKGEFSAELSLKNQVVERWQLSANATLTEPALAATFAEYGLQLNPVQLTISSEATAALDLAALPLQLQLSSEGPNAVTLTSELSLNLAASPRLTITSATLTAALARLTLPEHNINLHQLQLHTGLSGHWQADNWQLKLLDNSQLSLAVQHPQFTIKSAVIKLADTQLHQRDTLQLASQISATIQNMQHASGSIEQLVVNVSDLQLQQSAATGLQLSSAIDATITGLQQAAVKQQHWQWQATTQLAQQADNITLALQGNLHNDSGLRLVHQLNWQDATLSLNWQLADLFMLAGNPLASSFSDWPALLELNRGRLGGSGQLNWQAGQLTGNNQLQLRDLAGIYDRSLFQGLSADLQLTLQSELFQLTTANLVINHINHGLDAGPLQIAAGYQSTFELPERGVLTLEQLSLQLMGGTLSTTATQLDFAQSQNQLTLQLTHLDIAQLLQQHPSTDIKGQGKLSGTIPVTLGQAGITVEAGRVAAEAPGGKIQYRSAPSSGIGIANQSMQTVFSALEDFHFSVLASEVSYDTSGKLLLALNLQGLNPALQQGRAINLNINLEEDLPAMLTSLQLTNKLNDTITKRVQQYIQQKQAAAPAAGEKK